MDSFSVRSINYGFILNPLSSELWLRFDNDWIHNRARWFYTESMTLGTDVRDAIYREMAAQGLGLRQLARNMDRSHHWLGTKLRGTSPMNTDDIEEIAAGLGVDPLTLVHSEKQMG